MTHTIIVLIALAAIGACYIIPFVYDVLNGAASKQHFGKVERTDDFPGE